MDLARRMHCPFRVAASAIVLGLALSAGPLPTAHAEDSRSEARDLFLRASAAFDAHDYETAARLFTAANEIAPHGVTRYSAARAWQALGDAPRAADAFADAIDTGQLDPEHERDAQTQLASLLPKLGTIQITGPPGLRVSVEHMDAKPAPLRVHLRPGTHRLQLDFGDDVLLKREVTLAGGQTRQLAFGRPQTRRAPEKKPVLLPSDAGSSQRTLGYVGVGLGAVSAGAALYLGSQGLSARDQFNASGHTDRDAHDRSARLRTWADVAWAGALVLGGGGIVLVLSAPSSKERSVSRVELGTTGISYRGTF